MYYPGGGLTMYHVQSQFPTHLIAAPSFRRPNLPDHSTSIALHLHASQPTTDSVLHRATKNTNILLTRILCTHLRPKLDRKPAILVHGFTHERTVPFNPTILYSSRIADETFRNRTQMLFQIPFRGVMYSDMRDEQNNLSMIRCLRRL